MTKGRFDTILQLAEANENSAAQEFAHARADHEFNQEKLQELRDFRNEYEADAQTRPQHATAFQSTRKFLSQLCDVIEQQENEVQRTLQTMNDQKASWLERRVKRRSVEKLANKKALQLETEQYKREQKEMDEIANLNPTNY